MIIGAGAAGISAARYFQQNNIPFRLIEASHRVGGGAYSEAFNTGGWFDLGCSYLHEGEINPLCLLLRLALRLVMETGLFENWFMQQDSSGISAETLKAYIAFEDSVYDRMKAVAEGDDTSMAEQMDWASPFASVYNLKCQGSTPLM